MSSTLLFDFPDRLKEFHQRVVACETAIGLPDPDRQLVAAQIKQLQNMVEDQLLPLSLDAIPRHHQGQWLSLSTELQRTLRLLMTELSFWQMARSGDRQRHYQQRLQSHCQQLGAFAQAIAQWFPSP